MTEFPSSVPTEPDFRLCRMDRSTHAPLGGDLAAALAALKAATRKRHAARRGSAEYVAALGEEERLGDLVWRLSHEWGITSPAA